MAKVAASGSLSSNPLRFSGGALKLGAGVKRKTPSELRGEQLKRRNVVELIDESPAPLFEPLKDSSQETRGLKKSDPMKNPGYIDTRMDEVYPARKSRFRMHSGKENAQGNISIEQTSYLNSESIPSSSAGKVQSPFLCPDNSVAAAAVAKDGTTQACQKTEKSSQNLFRSVAELSLGNERLSGLGNVDMDKALKGLVAHEPPGISYSPKDSSERFGNFPFTYSSNLSSECIIPGQKTPLDLTLKTYMRVVSSHSVNWFHRTVLSGTYNGMPWFTFQNFCSEDQHFSPSSGPTVAGQAFNSHALHSWVYPQYSLPTSVVSVLTLSAAEGVETDFLSKRQLAWEDSFRGLYYMLRKNVCNIFYVCAPQFVVMFTALVGKGKDIPSCKAYISQSTRGLRSLLRENDVHFSMPLCRSKVEQVTTEDLVELSEIEKHSLGQTRHLNSPSDVDNCPQSLLVFDGIDNVHGLYDFLLNYRSFLTSLSGVDVPVLYSPVPFQNASLSAPEITCKELKRADHIAFAKEGSNVKDDESVHNSSTGLCYSIEIKDVYLPPWIICSVCAIMGSEGRSFEASFKTELTSIGLNVALENVHQKAKPQGPAGEDLQQDNYTFSIPNAIITPNLSYALLKSLKYCNNSYTASLSPL